ncbi:hypothetical protein KME70_08385 [Ralstonia solanacearum]|uniref:hypothetical protein n=1 Tax=Ralstonia solanacearum species complex bacterium KE101 TaxID=3119587 RepID=UPI0011C40D9F|nr:hypothetical protein KME70_08385 [Ralstonia solanacearum]
MQGASERLKSYVLYKSVERPGAAQQGEHHCTLKFLFLIFQIDTNTFPYCGKFFPIMKDGHGAAQCAIFADQNIFPHYEKTSATDPHPLTASATAARRFPEKALRM